MKTKKAPSDTFVENYRLAVGKNIRMIREKKGYSQDDLAEIMDIHRSTISKVETGKFAITIDYLVKFGWYLDFDISIVEK